ncbi:MAG: hypothetical protein DCC43_06825 [Candidatus Brocadia sp.]|nr:ATP-dependent helicase/nuclease subunit A [Candidatus Brocadia fulgida]MCC6325413.1 UvrD-helicase domain-containing protein [Candidatus Brocadia sp.]MCE7910943.1 hypothetical protein [Candidatus Brocadia sp. AMX3]MDG5997255.1 hypothetical protein [Candidatus Brocadia sp.]RIK00856.1 MAG: hypothetical protein DCC43_06825 [Candidatus Brocadia sp.]
MIKPIDNESREIAVSERERNIVVIAGAGTGKTTLLVNRVLHVLLGHKRLQKEESPILRIVAMTFTEKAASDMKVRLMGELEKIVAVIKGNASPEEQIKREKFLAHIRDTYHTTLAEIERRAKKSLEDMDKALIGTIHSFAAHLLRLYPLESGVVPGFIVDESDVFEEMFDKEWSRWIAGELTLDSSRAHLWKDVLRRLDLECMKDLAKRLSAFTIPLDSLTSPANDASIVQPLIDFLAHRITKIVASCGKQKNNLVLQLNELSNIFDGIRKHGIDYVNTLTYDLDKDPSKAKKDWTEEGFAAAQRLVKESHGMLKKLRAVDHAFLTAATDLILPFVKTFRQTYLSQGYISFDGLLTLTRDLLQKKECRHVREKLKDDFRVILVDEFQDTDPVQYEIVLFLSESLEYYSTDARKVILEEGKLFIVGDPKQSIYAFRRADIEAYEYVVKQVCGQDEPLKLQENFRSHSGIIEVVNQLFDGRIMVEQPGLQPRYISIHAQRQKRHSSQKVELVLVSDIEGNELSANEAREAEAEWIARWIANHVNRETMEDPLAANGVRTLVFRDVALLLRAFTQVRPYVEAFKRYGIPYIVEGEKYFYTTQEILDFINLLRVIGNPHDLVALVGVLRSPLAGLTDREIYELRVHHSLDYRKGVLEKIPEDYGIKDTDCHPLQTHKQEKEKPNLSAEAKEIAESFYAFLREIHARAGIIPVSQLIAEILDSAHIAEITASAWHGEQKLANLWKLHRMACDMEESAGISLQTFVGRIKTHIREGREEGESPLSDETLDVVKILTIHKSKGLEFPVIILGNLHGEVRNDHEVLDGAVFDWSTSTTGIVVGRGNQQVRNLQSMVIEKKLNDRSWEEEKRVLYVAMTRARERLILTGSEKGDDKSYMGMITQSVKDATGMEPGNEDKTADKEKSPLPLQEKAGVMGVSQGKFPLGNAEVFVEHFRFDGIRHPQKAVKEKFLNADWTAFVETWKKREAGMAEALKRPLFVSPTTIADEEAMEKDGPIAQRSTRKISHLQPGTSEQPRPENYPLSPPNGGGDSGTVMAKKIQPDTGQPYPGQSAVIGSLCHRVLEGWDFRGDSQKLQSSVESAVAWAIAVQKNELRSPDQPFGQDLHYQKEGAMSSEGEERGKIPGFHKTSSGATVFQDAELIKAEVIKILSAFLASETYRELQAAQILGREIPILLHWDGQVMRGAIDILYKMGDRVIIADYKTDHVTMTDLTARAEKYRYQKEVYVEAVKHCLKVDNPEFKIIFLRIGMAVSI